MRTTLTIDEDVAAKLEEERRRTQKAFKEIVNDALRIGLALQRKPKKPQPFVIRSHSCGGLLPGIDGMKLNQLNDELEAEHFARTQADPRK
ncbi:MAG: hypothetical protein ACT4TC_10260 [Myxococcaceae bacterium]